MCTRPTSSECDDRNCDFQSGHRYGNFSNYYNFHSVSERVGEVPDSVLRSLAPQKGQVVHVLDIGCNEGALSIAILMKLREALPDSDIRLLGIDLDSTLIEAARVKHASVPGASFECHNVMQEEFDHHISAFCQSENIKGFDLVTCFSTTMWIHLNYGDQGLKRLLSKLATACASLLVIEPQRWKSYKNAVERCRRRHMEKFSAYSDLTWRGTEVEGLISRYLSKSMSFELLQQSTCPHEIVSSDVMFWGRNMLIFRKHCVIATSSETIYALESEKDGTIGKNNEERERSK